MPTTTTNVALRKPLATDPPDGAGQIGNLADDVDALLYRYRTTDWATFTPAVSNLTLTLKAQYRQIGAKVHVRFYGSVTANAGNGSQIAIGLPMAHEVVSGLAPLPTGMAYGNHAGTIYALDLDFQDANTLRFYYRTTAAPGTLTPVTTAAPFAWAAGDAIYGEFQYDAA